MHDPTHHCVHTLHPLNTLSEHFNAPDESSQRADNELTEESPHLTVVPHVASTPRRLIRGPRRGATPASLFEPGDEFRQRAVAEDLAEAVMLFNHRVEAAQRLLARASQVVVPLLAPPVPAQGREVWVIIRCRCRSR